MAENYRNFAAAQSSVFPFTQNPPKNGADVDCVLSNNLAGIVPLDESLMALDSEGRKSVSDLKQRDLRVNTNEDSKFLCEEAKHTQNSGFELTSLNEGTRSLERQLLEEEEVFLQSAEKSLNQMSVLGEMRSKVAENDELLKAVVSELYDLKMLQTRLADKRATDNKSVDLEMEMISLKMIISAAFRELLPPLADESDMMQIKEAQAQYIAAIASMKSNHSVESIALALQARRRLYALLI